MFSICFGDSEAKSTPLLEPYNEVESGLTDVTSVTMEVVGATNLKEPCSFVIVKVGDKIVHRTSAIKNDRNPIWTVSSKSLCLLAIRATDTVTIELWNSKGIGQTQIVGMQCIDYDTLCNGNGSRIEYKYSLPPEEGNEYATMALRFRPASDHDLIYFQESKSLLKVPASPNEKSGDVDFKNVNKMNVFQARPRVENGVKKYRVIPGPDPDDPLTEWMTKDQINHAAMENSKLWAEVGYGNYGQVFVEILGCDNLPNMDTEMIDGLTDAFVSIVFEDSFVRSNVIYDSLNPRWMPWSDRAFAFNIAHPSSMLFLGIFDFDDVAAFGHDPISRIEIGLLNFAHDTVYTLTYPLHTADNLGKENEMRTITLRLRVKWNDLSEVNTALSFVSPPHFYVNTQTIQSWRVVRFLTRGSVDMQEVSVQSVKSYVQELTFHWKGFCYLLDVFAEIILWRGRIKLRGDNSMWFPLESVLLLAAVLFGIEHPELLPSLILYLIAGGLLSNNMALASHPSPWHRVKSFLRFGLSAESVSIKPGTGEKEADTLRWLYEYKSKRVMAFLYEVTMIFLELYQTSNKTIPLDISTVESKENFLSTMYINYLSYVHSLLQSLCKKVRLLKDFVNWKTYSTYKVTILLLACATTWWLFPYKYLVPVTLRIFAFGLFGPHWTIIDRYFIREYYRTEEQLLKAKMKLSSTDEMEREISGRKNILDWLKNVQWVNDAMNSGRVNQEDNMKLRDFRRQKYGFFSENIHYRASVHPSVPLPSSFAYPYGTENESTTKRWSYIPGQKLQGCLIPQPKSLGMMSSSSE